MQGKLHPYWYIPTTKFPYTFTIRAYSSDWPWYHHLETDNKNIKILEAFYSTNSDDYIPITFNSKVSQFTLIDKVFTTSSPSNDDTCVFIRRTPIYCYYPDDFTIVSTLSPQDGSLTESDLDLLVTYDGTDTPNVSTNTFNYYNKLYVGRSYNQGWAWKIEVNLHTLAKSKNITDYDFVLMKYVYKDKTGHKAIVSNRNYYPIGWFDDKREYWTLLSKQDNERLYCVRRSGWYGIGIREIQYLKLKTNSNSKSKSNSVGSS